MRRLYALAIGSLALLVVVEIVLGVGYRVFVAAQMAENRRDLSDDQVRILCIGESTTAVAGNPDNTMLDRKHSYPTQLEALLDARNDGRDYRVLNLGIMAGTTESILQLLPATLEEFQPHIIISMMGIKDGRARGAVFELPQVFQKLNTVKLLDWLLEDRQLRREAVSLDVSTVADLPPSMRGTPARAARYAMDTRLGRDTGPEARAGMDAITLAIYYWYIGRLTRAEEILRTSIQEVDIGHNVLARVLFTAGRGEEALELLQTTIETHPEEGLHRVLLAELFIETGRYDEAEAVLEEGFARLHEVRQPQRVAARLTLVQAEVERLQGAPEKALEILYHLDPALLTTHPAHIGIAKAQMDLENWDQAESHLKHALELRPGRHAFMFMLSQVYRAQDRYEDEERMRKALLTHNGRMAEYFEIAKMFRVSGNAEQVPALLESAVAQIPSLRTSHAALYGIAKLHGAQLVVMQYPSFSLDLLRLYAPPEDGVLFVDNEHIFDADPDAYWFEPSYPHSFSHYTREGAQVLATHIADTIDPLLTTILDIETRVER